MPDLIQRVLGFIQREGLASGGETLLVGVSGGPDSACLVHVLNELKETLGVGLHVVHLNHMLRGAASDADAEYVSLLAQHLGLPATLGKRDVSAYREERKISLEEAARQVRYDFFAETAASLGTKYIALGHTADDQAETVLMHIVRGTGLVGLRGMQARSQWHEAARSVTVVRPLLEITRKETEAYCQAHDLRPRLDVSNYSLEYMRNRFRHELVPLLEQLNPNFRAALLRTSRIAQDAISYLDQRLSLVWDEAVQEKSNGLSLDLPTIANLHPALKQYLMRQIIERLQVMPRNIEAAHIESMIEALGKPAGTKISLPQGIVFEVGYGTCLVFRPTAAECTLPRLEEEYPLNLKGETVLPGWRAKCEIVASPFQTPSDRFRAYLDVEKTGRELFVRGRSPGDRFWPLGMGQPKKLQDFMVDAKIPFALRDSVPLVCSPDQILWVVGWRIAESAKVTETTRQAVSLEFCRKQWILLRW